MLRHNHGHRFVEQKTKAQRAQVIFQVIDNKEELSFCFFFLFVSFLTKVMCFVSECPDKGTKTTLLQTRRMFTVQRAKTCEKVKGQLRCVYCQVFCVFFGRILTMGKIRTNQFAFVSLSEIILKFGK